jgi:ribosome-associated translation inhibitor RaiA
MHVQINTDNNIAGREALASHISEVVERALARFSDRITRVEVHVGDENGPKSGPDDKRCTMEVRLAGRQPTAVSCRAGTVAQAVDGAADKLKRAVETTIEKAAERRH